MLSHNTTLVRSFPMAATVDIPRRLAEYRRGDRILFVAITKASYIVVGEIGADFIRMFEDEIPLGVALSSMISKYGSDKESEIRSILSDLLVQIETRQFYQHAVITEDMLSPTMLARITNRCNLRCTHCLVSSSPEWPTDQDLSTQDWCNVIDSYYQFIILNSFSRHRLTLSGGEALSRRDALEIAQHSKSLGIHTELFSNGTLIVNNRIAQAVAASVDEIQISLDGATAPVHDCIRGDGMFARTIRGIRLLRDANARIRVAMVVMPQNFEDLSANLVPLVKQLGAGFNVGLALAVEEGRGSRSMQFSSTADGEAKMKGLLAKLTEAGIRSTPPITPNLKLTSCGYAREITVNNDGLVYGCGPQKYPIGNLKLESFMSIADRTIHKSRRAEIDHVDGCRDCNIRYVCGGTCRLNNISRMGRTDVSCCDRENKERNLMRLFARGSDLVPLNLLRVSPSNRTEEGKHSTSPVITERPSFVPLSSLVNIS